MTRCQRFLCGVFFLCLIPMLTGMPGSAGQVRAEELPAQVYIGVLANRGKDAALRQWGPHAEYLNDRLAPLRFEILPLTFAELDRAVAQHGVQFVITNTGHYSELEYQGQVSRIATLRRAGPRGPLDRFGGVAISRAGRDDINTYADLKGKRLLIPNFNSLGGWQVHLREALDAGVDLLKDSGGIEQTQDHEKVVQGILAGRADVGLVRSDLLEQMASEGRLKLSDIKVIHQRIEGDFPYLLSTRLYPEWPLAKVRGIPDELAKQVLIALLDLLPDAPAARAAGLYSWALPLNYQPVQDLFREARLGPYARLPITFHDILASYTLPIAAGAGLIFALLGGGFAFTAGINRSLKRAIRRRMEIEQSLEESERRFKTMADAIATPIWVADPDKVGTFFNKGWLDFTGRPLAAVLGEGWLASVHPEDRPDCERAYRAAFDARHPFTLECRLLHASGEYRWIANSGTPRYTADGEFLGYVGFCADISALKTAQEKVSQAAVVFDTTTEGIMFTDARERITLVNQAFSEITGYTHEDVIGQSPRILSSGRHPPEFHDAMRAQLRETGKWQGEVWNRRKNGEVYPVWQSITAISDAEGEPSGYISLFSDITHLKQSEAQLKHLAYHDPLTGLPNRLLFDERLEHAIQQARRREEKLAVLYFDLDNFKPLNDALGHHMGDELLEAVARRISGRLRKSDTLSRRGGDEFTVLAENIDTLQDAVEIAEDINQQLHLPFRLSNDRDVTSACSTGIAFFPEHGDNAQDLIRRADAAMYAAKQAGRGRHCVYAPDKDTTSGQQP